MKWQEIFGLKFCVRNIFGFNATLVQFYLSYILPVSLISFLGFCHLFWAIRLRFGIAVWVSCNLSLLKDLNV